MVKAIRISQAGGAEVVDVEGHKGIVELLGKTELRQYILQDKGIRVYATVDYCGYGKEPSKDATSLMAGWEKIFPRETIYGDVILVGNFPDTGTEYIINDVQDVSALFANEIISNIRHVEDLRG